MPFQQREERNKLQEAEEEKLCGGDLLGKQSRTDQGVKRSCRFRGAIEGQARTPEGRGDRRTCGGAVRRIGGKGRKEARRGRSDRRGEKSIALEPSGTAFVKLANVEPLIIDNLTRKCPRPVLSFLEFVLN